MRLFTSVVVLACYLSTTCVAIPSKPTGKSIEVDVAIIGGGASGIHAAISLKDAGAKVAVIEKRDKIGGHAETYVNPKTKAIANIGVVIFENTKTVQNYFDRLGVEHTIRNPLDADTETKQYDFSLGIPIPPQDDATAAANQKALVAAIQSYTRNVLTKYPWIDRGYPFVPNPVPEELLQPFGEFAQQNNFTALLPLIAQFGWYPGNITTIPTLYGIKKFGPGLMQSINTGFLVPKSGNARDIYQAAALELADETYLSSNIESVQRNEDIVVVTIRQPGRRITFKARKLLVAIPQTLKNVGSYDLSAAEKKLFSKFSALGYVAGVANIAGVDVNLQNVGALTPSFLEATATIFLLA
jgi:monoamine oxidase